MFFFCTVCELFKIHKLVAHIINAHQQHYGNQPNNSIKTVSNVFMQMYFIYNYCGMDRLCLKFLFKKRVQ